MSFQNDDTSSPVSGLAFDNSFARLGPGFFTRLQPQTLDNPYLVAASAPAAALLGMTPDQLARPHWVQAMAGNRPLQGADPLAAVYSGHQFGVWAGQLGDGRALLLGETQAPDGRRWEIQLKGAGKTPYSRMGDGRAVLRSSIRELLCSEAMHHLGIPTSRALAVVGADMPVFRETVETAAVAVRLAPSFIRFGSFEHFYAARDPGQLRLLADYVIDRFYPEAAAQADPVERYTQLLTLVAERTARLIARWQAVGFCHGVMNTDNMSILGLTIDYGPFGFLDGFDANHICNHSDDSGRYAYSMQPRIGEWNSYCLGQALMPLIGDVERAQAALASYQPVFDQALAWLLAAKLGLAQPQAGDQQLIDQLFTILDRGRVDFTLFFRNLSRVSRQDASGDAGCRDLFIDRAAFDGWATSYRQRLGAETRDDAQRARAMNQVNPKYILRNHLAETAIRLARGSNESARIADPNAPSDQDFSEVSRLMKVLEKPYDEQPEHQAYAALPPDWSKSLSVSCSS